MVDQEERGSFYDYYSTTIFSATVRRLVFTSEQGQVTTESLLNRLAVGSETHAGSYTSSRFPHWIDADRDGEKTRTEVLKSESTRRVTATGDGTIRAGR